jgi:hypothetical protein
LLDAEKAGAIRYAETVYREADRMIQVGWMEMARQNGRLAPLRDYEVADSILSQAAFQAQNAAQKARDRVRNLDSTARTERDELRDELSKWLEALNGSLAKSKLERRWKAAEMALEMSDRLVANQEYEPALNSVERGHEALRQLRQNMADYAEDDARKIAVWRRWVGETVQQSKVRNSYAVVVDKSAHKSYLIRGGKVIRTYNCELGYNSERQKLFSGDAATPEGQYRVTTVKARGSKYYKALLLNYPNDLDWRRFRENKSNGIISQKARIGGLIEIHGEGGRSRDWTQGCVALSNKEMDHLMQFASVGMPVTIVRRSDKWP